MKRTTLIFGLVIGAMLTANAIVMMNMMTNNPDFKGNAVIGYTAQVIMFSLIYLGVRSYRNNHLDGTISFGKALKTGALICLVASTVYVIVGLAYYYLFAPDFIDVYSDYVIRNAAPENVEAVTEQMANFKEMYKNLLFTVLITYMEVLPVGMVVALVSAFFVKKK